MGRIPIHRREFLTAAAIMASQAPAFAGTPAKTVIDIKTVTSDIFKKFTGQNFSYGKPGQVLLLETVTVVSDPNGAGKRPKKIRQETFSLLFSAPPNIILPEGMYNFTNPNVTPFSLYISRVAITAKVTSASSSSVDLVKIATSVVAKSKTPKCYYEAAFS